MTKPITIYDQYGVPLEKPGNNPKATRMVARAPQFHDVEFVKRMEQAKLECEGFPDRDGVPTRTPERLLLKLRDVQGRISGHGVGPALVNDFVAMIRRETKRLIFLLCEEWKTGSWKENGDRTRFFRAVFKLRLPVENVNYE